MDWGVFAGIYFECFGEFETKMFFFEGGDIMPDFDDRERKPESQSRKEQARPVCKGVLRPMAYARSSSLIKIELVDEHSRNTNDLIKSVPVWM